MREMSSPVVDQPGTFTPTGDITPLGAAGRRLAGPRGLPSLAVCPAGDAIAVASLGLAKTGYSPVTPFTCRSLR